MMDASPGLGCKAQVTSTVVGIDASEKVGSPAPEEPGRGCRAYLVFGYSAPP